MFVRRLGTVCSISVETGERAGNRVLQLRSTGFLEFAVKPRSDSTIVDLHLVDAEARLEPFDVEVDGRPVRVEDVRLAKRDFDLAGSIGEVDQESQEGWFRLRLTLTRRHLAFLREAGIDVTRIPVEIVERGRIDLARGRILETHAEKFELPRDVPAELVRQIGRGGGRSIANSKNSCAVTDVRLVGVLSDLYDSSLIKERQALGDMIVCPGEKVTLAWYIDDAGAVNDGYIIEHNSGDRWPIGAPGPDGIGTQDIVVNDDGEYQVVIDDPSCAPNSGRLKIWVVEPGKEILISANQTPSRGVYVYDAPMYTIGSDVHVTSIVAVDCGWPFAVDPWGVLWAYQFTDQDGRILYGNSDVTWRPTPRDLQLQGSNWVFEALATTGADNFPFVVCFMIRCACHPPVG